MSGQQMLETLRQLGYPKADQWDPQMFDWLFEKKAMVPFLEWFVTSVHSDNVISQDDYTEYKELEEKSADGLLEGRQLEEAIRQMSVLNKEEDMTEEALSEDICRLKRDLDRNNKKKEKLMQRRNRLSVHHTSLSHKLAKLTPIETQVRNRFKKSVDKIHEDNKTMNESMDGLLNAVSRVTSLYKPVADMDSTDAVFLSQVNLEEYYQKEEKYTQQVTAFTKKQFFQNIGKITGEGGGSRFELLEVKDPESLLVHGENESNTVQDCKELTRLQNIYPVSETERIVSTVEDKSVRSAVNTANDILNLLQSGNFPLDTNKLSTQIQEAQFSVQNVRRDLSKLLEGDIPQLVRELAPLQGTQILTGDYTLKLARQDYFTSNQDKVIELLVSQRARNEFLTMAYEVEARQHRDLHRHLTAIRLQLQQHLTNWQHRMTLMGDTSLTPAKYERGTLDSRDTATTRLYHMLEETEGDKQLFLTYSNLLEGGERLQRDHKQAYTNMNQTATKYYDKLHQLEDDVRKCERTIYEGSSTTSGLPALSPPEVQNSIKQLEALLQTLEANLLDRLGEVNNKKTALREDSISMRERSLFVDFFLEPARIQQALDNVSNRIQALNVQ